MKDEPSKVTKWTYLVLLINALFIITYLFIITDAQSYRSKILNAYTIFNFGLIALSVVQIIGSGTVKYRAMLINYLWIIISVILAVLYFYFLIVSD